MKQKKVPAKCRAIGRRRKARERAVRAGKKAGRDRNWKEAPGLAQPAERRTR